MPKRPTQLTFAAPKQVVQVFRWHTVQEKEEYRTPEVAISRKQIWQQPIRSTSGFVNEDQLVLPTAITEQVDFERSDLIMLEDNPWSSLVHCLSVRNARRQFDMMFRIGLKPDDECYWLSFRYPGPIMMGYPTRDDFDLSPLRAGHPVRVLVNGRTWHSVVSRRQTKYREWDFVFAPLGEFTGCALADEVETMKVVPEAKLIDLRKEMF